MMSRLNRFLQKEYDKIAYAEKQEYLKSELLSKWPEIEENFLKKMEAAAANNLTQCPLVLIPHDKGRSSWIWKIVPLHGISPRHYVNALFGVLKSKDDWKKLAYDEFDAVEYYDANENDRDCGPSYQSHKYGFCIHVAWKGKNKYCDYCNKNRGFGL